MKEPSKRVRELLAGMTVEQKALQLSCIVPTLGMKNGQVQKEKLEQVIPAGIGRMTQYAMGFLGGPRQAAEGYNAIQAYVMEKTGGVPVLIQNESAAGLMAAGATLFPVPIAIASTWRPQLANTMGEVIRNEAKAIGVRVAMSPVADVARDARWGRVGETFGEDPMLAARFSAEKAKGMQGEDYGKNVVSLAKHFMGYGMSEVGVNAAVISMGRKEMFEVYGTPFAAAVKEADMQGVMVTYSEIDGLPMSVNEYYTKQVLREDMGFTGTAICDGGSIPRCHQIQGMYHSLEELAGRSLRAGIDADTPFTQVYDHIKSGVEQGLVDEADLDECVLRILTQKEELGLLDEPYIDASAAESVFARPEGKALAREMAQQEITLLKNENSLLPLKKDMGKIALVGPFADRLSTLFGGYAYPSTLEMLVAVALGTGGLLMEGFSDFIEKMMDKEYVASVLDLDKSLSYQENVDRIIRSRNDIETLKEALAREFPAAAIVCEKGLSGAEDWRSEIDQAVKAAVDSEVIVLALGEVTGFGKDATSGEGHNNPDLRLPGHQQELVLAMAALKKPMVLVLFNGRPLALADVEPYCAAIVEAWYPGPFGGEVIAGVLAGRLNPGGKLPVTFPRISAQCPLYYGHKAGSGYMSIHQKPLRDVLQPLYPFGHGLSYTRFAMEGLSAPQAVAIGETFEVSVEVENTGAVAGDEVVQVYTRTKQASVVRPVKELRAFLRVSLAPGERRTVRFTLDTHQFGYYNYQDRFVVEPSTIDLMVGSSSSDILQMAEFTLTGVEKEILHQRSFGFEAELV